ncbi:hypothetical protein ONZ45_g9613 [Pleurotus djamor]|nr:hypothetical protein ONZ45_g9613 [Pleurotus djamor]
MDSHAPRHFTRRAIHLRRAEQPSDNKQTTTIIIAVCVGVASAILLLFIARFILRIRARRPSRSAPLPQVQPLAHDRERRLAQLEAWQDSSYPILAPHTASDSTAFMGGSKVSLITDETTPVFPLVSQKDPSLPLPHPSFHHNSATSSSSGLSDADVASTSPTPPQTPSLSQASFPHLANTGSRSDSPSSMSISPSRMTSQRKPRPVSSVSNASIYTTRSSRNTLRGTPHSPHSNVQIVLPAPLAPELLPTDSINAYGRQSVYYDPSHIRRMSLADKWAPPTTRTERPASREQRRSLSTSEKPSFVSLNEADISTATGHRPPRRVSSSPNGFPEQIDPSFMIPPVPPIPSVHRTPSPADSNIPASESGSDEKDPTPERSGPRKLRKRSQSRVS